MRKKIEEEKLLFFFSIYYKKFSEMFHMIQKVSDTKFKP